MDRRELTFGIVLGSLRSERGLSQRDLSAKLGLHDVAIQQYESDRRSPSPAMVERIAAALACSPAEEAWLWHCSSYLPPGTPYYTTLLCVITRASDRPGAALDGGHLPGAAVVVSD